MSDRNAPGSPHPVDVLSLRLADLAEAEQMAGESDRPAALPASDDQNEGSRLTFPQTLT